MDDRQPSFGPMLPLPKARSPLYSPWASKGTAPQRADRLLTASTGLSRRGASRVARLPRSLTLASACLLNP